MDADLFPSLDGPDPSPAGEANDQGSDQGSAQTAQEQTPQGETAPPAYSHDTIYQWYQGLPDSERETFRKSELAQELGRSHADERFRGAQSRLEGYRRTADDIVRDFYANAGEHIGSIAKAQNLDEATFQALNQRSGDAIWNVKLFDLDKEIRNLEAFRELEEWEIPLSLRHLRDSRRRGGVWKSWLTEFTEKVSEVERAKLEAEYRKKDSERLKQLQARARAGAQAAKAPVQTGAQAPAGSKKKLIERYAEGEITWAEAQKLGLTDADLNW